jgi:DNA-binding MarR family transcriptional regulator
MPRTWLGYTLRCPTIGTLAERLQLRHHSAVGLVDRLARRGMVGRTRDPRDRRGVLVELRPAGEKVLERLARQSLQELSTEGPELLSLLRRLIRAAGPDRRAKPRR